MSALPPLAPPQELAPPRPAASVILLRDGPNGLEALLLERPSDDRVLSGAQVFPGGKVDPEDADEAWAARFGTTATALCTRLGEPDLEPLDALALRVAAVREVFEETGLLLAREADHAQARRAQAMRREGLAFAEIVETLDLRFDAAALPPWSRWVTPRVPSQMRRRFDTRFFAAVLPQGQAVVHDPTEAVAAAWWNPREAITRYHQGELEMAAPQLMTLAHLARCRTVAEALAEAIRQVPPVIRPEPHERPNGRLLCYPGDPGHPVAERALPGPTRLIFEQGRFRPESGRLEAWFE